MHYSFSSLVSNDRSSRRVNHGGIVDCRKVAVNQVKLVFAQEDRPDCLDLRVCKRLSHTAMSP